MKLGLVLDIVCIYTLLVPNIYMDAAISSLSALDSEVANILDGYYDLQSILPVQTVGTPLAVTVDFDLVSIVYFDDDSSHVTIAGYLTLVWTEERYTRVTDNIDVGVLASTIWTPPVSVVNSMMSTATVGSKDDIAIFNLNTGRVVWKPWVYTKVACDSNSFFPFDKHECSVKVSSIISGSTDMTLAVADDSVGTQWLEQHNSWKVVSTSATGYTIDSTPYVVYKFKIQRRPSFLTLILVCPFLVISILHLFVFLIPEKTDQRSILCVLSMIGILISLLWTVSYIPAGTTPISIIVFYLFTEFLLDFAVVVVAIVFRDSMQNVCNRPFCDDLVTGRKSKKVSNKNVSGLGPQVSDQTQQTTQNTVGTYSVATAWDDDASSEYTTEIVSENTTVDKSQTRQKSVSTFLFFLVLHLFFSIAFLISLGLNVE